MKCVPTLTWSPARTRKLLITVGAVLSTTLLVVIIHQAILPILAWFFPSLISPLYDLAVYGAYPSHKYVSFDLIGPWANVVQWDESCDDGYVLLSLFGPSVPDGGPMILDARGNLIWMVTGFQSVLNLKVQRYQNQDYLTFWAGSKHGSMGEGHYYMLDSNYDIVHNLSAVGQARMGDLHEFIITDEGTALITVYVPTKADLSAMGRPKDGWIIDSLFQEFDIATGNLIFEWRASEHFNPAESYYIDPFGGYKEDHPYDFFHINSVQKDSQGNYLISSRHLHAVMTVSPEGSTLWVLGGMFNEFDDLTEGKATSFSWQHDARWVDERAGVLSLFDNGNAGPIMTNAAESTGIIIQIDVAGRTTKLLHSYSSLQHAKSASQGSLQILPNDHVFIGWGSSAAHSEHTMDGRLLCETHVGASWLWWWERVKSYRAIKNFSWTGTPNYPPMAKISGDRVYVSWNGATEVRAWQLEGKQEKEGEGWHAIDIMQKEEFEESFSLPAEALARYRVVALDGKGEVIGTSGVVVFGGAGASKPLMVLYGVGISVGLAAGVWMFKSKILKSRGILAVWDTHKYRKVPGIEMN